LVNTEIMARQWRIEYPGALYHVLSRGNNRQNIFVNDDDRQMFLELMEELSEGRIPKKSDITFF